MASSSSQQGIQAYFSHSYRASDRDINLFFWKLFSEENFFFTVDPKSDRLIVPHLERMMRYSDCFIAVVSGRHEEIHGIDDVEFSEPRTHFTHSPYIAFENYLAELAEKPRLVFVEQGLNTNIFGEPDCVYTFERMTISKKERQFRGIVHEFAEKVRAYVSYKSQTPRPTAKAGIVVDPKQKDSYSPLVISNIQTALSSIGGYSSEVISPHFDRTQDFLRKLSGLELVVTDIRSPYITPEALSLIQAKALPSIRLAKLQPKEVGTQIQLPKLLEDYQVGNDVPVITWSKREDLILEIYLYLSKFIQPRTLFDSFDEGKRYFVSAGRKSEKVFISNPHSLNPLALALVKGFQGVNIEYFQYQSSMAVGTTWQSELQKELQNCKIFVALINDDYHNSDWCKLELETAFKRWQNKEVVILPYIVESTRLPELIKDDIQCQFVHEYSEQGLVSQIVDTIDSHLTSIEEHGAKGQGEDLRKEMYGKGEKWAVLVGANQYEDTIHFPALQVCVKDVKAVKERFVKSGYDEEQIKILSDEEGNLPTKDNILVALKSAADATEPDDLLLFYYSGHGIEKNGESYLVARNGRQLVIEETAIAISKIKEIMRSAPARAKVIILDACHSGVSFGKGEGIMTEEFISSVFEEAKGFAIFASCEQGQLSYEWHQNDRSVFTHYLLDALRGEADFEKKGFVTVQDVNRFVSGSVKRWANKQELSQTPTLHYEVSGDIILVRTNN